MFYETSSESSFLYISRMKLKVCLKVDKLLYQMFLFKTYNSIAICF